MPDPNWLLSSTAQSAAALVAIMGGLIVSRMISLSAERQSLIRRRDELNDRTTIKHQEAKARRTSLIDEDVRGGARVKWAKAILDAPTISDEELYRLDDGDGWPLEVLVEPMTRVRASVADLLPRVESVERLSARDPGDIARELGAEQDEDLVGAIHGWVRERAEAPVRAMGLAVPALKLGSHGSGPAVASIAAIHRRNADWEKYEQVRSEVDALRAEATLASEAVDRVQLPTRLVGGFWVLGGFSASGIVFPLIVMAFQPQVLHVGWRVAVLVGFIGGLAALLVYIVSFMNELRGTTTGDVTADGHR